MEVNLDIIGLVIEFLPSTKTFFDIYTLSKSVKWYLENEHPEASRYVKFSNKKGVEVKSKKKYVTWLGLVELVPFKFFPRVKYLQFELESITEKGFDFHSDTYFLELTKLRFLESLQYNSGPKINDDHLKSFENIKKVVLHFQEKVTCKGIGYLKNVEDLDLVSCKVEELPRGLVKLKHLTMYGYLEASGTFKNYKNDTFVHYFPQLKSLAFSGNKVIQDSDLAHMKKIRRLFIDGCSKITNKGLFNLPTNLREFGVGDNIGITNEGLARFQNLESLHTPFKNTGVDEKILKKLSNLQSLTFSAKNMDFRKVMENITCKLTRLCVYGFSTVYSTLEKVSRVEDECFELFERVPNIRMLEFLEVEFTDGALKLIATNCTKLKKLVVVSNKTITDEGIQFFKRTKIHLFNCTSVKKKSDNPTVEE